MNKKVILSVTNDLVSDQRVHKMATSLTKFGYEVTLIGRKFKDSPYLVREYKTKRISLFFNTKIWFYAEYNIRLFFYLLFHNFDIYVANDLDTILPNFIVSRIKRKKFVYDSHELFTEVVELNTRPLQKKIWLFIEKIILPKSKNNITVCKSIADYYKKKYGNKFSVIRNIPIFKNKTDTLVNNNNEDKVVIYQGALNKDRGLELMIEAFAFIENAKFWIVGSGDVEQELKLLVDVLNLSDKVVFKGRMPLEDMPKITNKASLGLSLEEDTSLSYHYALPNKMFDYIQAGVPV
ncbi:MAG: glycosyltransferase, partial [Flavobacteriales bacterium]|nr:glycosyltransferase [Flavobacteriales bacterium]